MLKSRVKLEFPGFAITGDPSLLEIAPTKMIDRREFAKCATLLELQYMQARRSDLAGAVMIQKSIEAHELNVLKAIMDSEENLTNGINNVADSLPQLMDIKAVVGEKLQDLKREGIVDSESLAKEVRKELNDMYGLKDLCNTLKRAYSSDGQVTNIIRNIDRLVHDVENITNIIKEKPTEEQIADAVTRREKERFDQIKEQLNKMGSVVNEVRSDQIRRVEKMRAIIEAEEQEFEKMGLQFLHDEYNPRYNIIDVRDKFGALGRKTGDVILVRNGTHNYKIVIDLKKTNPKDPRIISLREAQDIAENAVQNRKADASIICTQLAEQLPIEDGIYLFDYRTILTDVRHLRIVIDLIEILLDFDQQKKQKYDINGQRVNELIKRLKEGDTTLETTIKSLKQAKSCIDKSLTRLIDYQEQVANSIIRELKIIIS